MNYSQKLSLAIVGIFALSGCLTVRLPEVQIRKTHEPQTLSWGSLVRQALSLNPDLQAARYLVTASARSRDIAFGDYLPSVGGGFERDISRTTGIGSTKDGMGLDISADQSLFDGFGTTGKWLKTRKELEAVKLAYVETSADVRFRLRSAYIDMIRLERLVATNRQIEERRRQNSDLIRLRYDAGRENLGSALRAEALTEQAVFDVKQAERELESEALRLARESGGEFVYPLRMADDFEKMVQKVSLASADYVALAEKTPKVMRLVKTAEAAKAEVVKAQSVVWPQVDGTYDYGYTGDRASNMKDQSSLGVQVNVPFFNGGKNVNAIRKAKADYEAAERAAQSARDEAIAALAEARTSFVDAIEYVEVRKKFLDAAGKRAEIIRAQYSTGLANFTDFDAAEQENATAEKAYVESLADIFIQQANWDKVRGATLEDAYHENK